jgi:phosphoribosylamine--glycine ligase
LKVLLLGSGGREHALAWALRRSPALRDLFVAPGNAGTARIATNAALDASSSAEVVAFARDEAIDLVVIGPEVPLVAGVADALRAAGVLVFGPGRDGARLEGSKAHAKAMMEAEGVPTARSAVVRSVTEASKALAWLGDHVAVKADGLAAGKGVVVTSDLDVAIGAITELGRAGPLVIEERLSGREASCIAICDGRDALALPIARDHKRLADGDNGPNTGGMGAYSPLADLPDEAADEILATIHRPILAELARRGHPFRGALYAGLMLTDDGPVLLECNARFLPSTQRRTGSQSFVPVS